MEGKKQLVSSSSSSFTHLFGPKDSSLSSGIFGSIFPPPSKDNKREYVFSEWPERKEESANSFWNSKAYAKDTGSWSKVDHNKIQQNDDLNSYHNKERVQPSHLCSSIYYGGPDVFPSPKNTPKSEYYMYKKYGEEDDSGSASMGNLWEGSLYY